MVSNTSRNGGAVMIGLNRRRTMSSKTTLTPIDRLKQLGCLMWFPLNYANGLNDVIGGRVITPVNSNYFVYQSGYGSYEFRFTSFAIGSIDISDLTSADFVDGGFTTFFSARRHGTSSLRGYANCWECNGVKIGFSVDSTNHTTYTPNWVDNSWNEGVIVRHQDGSRELYANQTLFNNNPATYPDIWNYSTIDIKSTNNTRLPAKNFLLFNRALTASEIAEVHQIISQ